MITHYKDASPTDAAEIFGRVRSKKCIRVVRELIALVYGAASDNAGSRTLPNR